MKPASCIEQLAEKFINTNTLFKFKFVYVYGGNNIYPRWRVVVEECMMFSAVEWVSMYEACL